jgi:hypothetical protein
VGNPPSVYNVVVVLVGVVSVFLTICCGVLAEPLVGEAIGIPDGAIFIPFGAIVFVFLANVFYTGGWIAELFLSRLKPDSNTNAFGVRAFRLGVSFSILVTLFPAVLSWAVFLFSLATEDEQYQRPVKPHGIGYLTFGRSSRNTPERKAAYRAQTKSRNEAAIETPSRPDFPVHESLDSANPAGQNFRVLPASDHESRA